MQEIIVDIDEVGNVKIEATGFTGKECEDFTRDIEQALGDVTKRELKPEHRQTVGVKRKAGA